MDDNFAMQPADRLAPAIDPVALTRLFALGDAALRVALCAQLRDDFSRLHAAVGAGDPAAVSRAAHELKGLSATVGAYRLAEIAAIVDARVQTIGDTACALVIAQLRHEAEAVLTQLEHVAKGGAGA